MDSLVKSTLKTLAYEACDYVHYLAKVPKEKLREMFPRASSSLERITNAGWKINLKRFAPDPTKKSYDFEAEVELPPKWGYDLQVDGFARLKRN